MNKIKFIFLTFLSINLSAAIPNPPDLGVGSYILYEPNTKKVLASFNADAPVEPASLTKLMTSYVVADYIKEDFIDKGLVKFEHHPFPLDLAALNAEKILRCPSNKEERLKLLDEIYDKSKIENG